MQPEFLTVGERAVQVLETWQVAYASIQGAGVPLDSPSAHTPGTTVSDINARTTAALAALTRLRDAKIEQLELLANRLPALKAAIDTVDTQSQSIIATMQPWFGATSTDRNGHLQLQMQHPEKGSQNFDLGSPLSAIAQQVGVALDALPYITQALGDEAITIFAGLARAAEQYLAQAQAAAAAAKKEQASGTTTALELKSLAEQATSLVQQIQEQLGAVGTQKTTVDANAAEVVQKLAQAREVSKDADTLQQRVAGFSSQFEAFDAQMKTRLEQFAQFDSFTKEAQRINKEREEKIAELTEKADTMIRGATTAGLSKSLEDAKDEYERRLNRTQWFFLGSVVFLLVSALPIAAQLIPGPWQQFFAPSVNGAASESVHWLSALGKLILVLPGTWATAFFASNYAELFHLSREYAHKAALAKAIDGFQREAPDYKQEIVGSVFMEIQDNPGSRKAPPPATPQNPVTQKFLEKVLDAIKVVKK
jgi:CII-binding regulator of phage lambda lysogenization HflD